MDKRPNVSVIVPIYNMSNAKFFLQRNLESIAKQTYKDYEIVISDDSEDDMLKIWVTNFIPVKYVKNTTGQGMARNTNNAIEHATGKIVKVLYQDDYFSDENSLQLVVNEMGKAQWLVTGCTHTNGRPHLPKYNPKANTIGSPSVLSFKRDVPVRFDPKFYWVLDLDFYRKMFDLYGEPKYLNEINVVIGIGEHQSTALLSDERKAIEEKMMQ